MGKENYKKKSEKVLKTLTSDLKNKSDKNPKSDSTESPLRIDGTLMKRMLRLGARELRANVDEINALNVFPVPDGDTGDNMLSTVQSGLFATDGLDTNDLSAVMRALSHGMLLGARGNSGVILSQLFKGISDGVEKRESLDHEALASALAVGVKEAYKTVVNPTEGTILTVVREAVEYATSRINFETTVKSYFTDFVNELRESVERTPLLLPALKEADVVDSGGAGLFYLMYGFMQALYGEEFNNSTERVNISASTNLNPCGEDEEKCTELGLEKASGEEYFSFGNGSETFFLYCTELLVGITKAKSDTCAADTEEIRDFLSSAGNSCAVVKSGGVIKIHVHTSNPGRVLEYMINYGEFIDVKIENMSIQHSEMLNAKEKTPHNSKQFFTKNKNSKSLYKIYESLAEATNESGDRKKYGVVAVSSGNGTNLLFKSLGADEIIDARDGRNPSAEDFLKSAERINAKEVFIFPNNSNFILSAEQAKKMAEIFTIHVIPSKNIAFGYAALSVMDFERESTEEIMRSAIKVLNTAKSGAVFTSARDTKCSGMKIKAGDTLGAIDKNIVAKGKDSIECSVKICKKLITGRYMLTIFKGEDAKDEDLSAIERRIKKFCPDADVYTIDSGQEIFEYIFLAE